MLIQPGRDQRRIVVAASYPRLIPETSTGLRQGRRPQRRDRLLDGGTAASPLRLQEITAGKAVRDSCTCCLALLLLLP